MPDLGGGRKSMAERALVSINADLHFTTMKETVDKECPDDAS
jgi:hypothetical protein